MRPAAFAEASISSDPDIPRFARMTVEQRLALFLERCDLTDAIQAGRPNRDALRAPQPRSVESLALWTKLMSKACHGKYSRGSAERCFWSRGLR